MPALIACKQQHFGQNLGCLISNDAVVTKRFVIQAGFFQTLPRGSVRTNAIDQVLIAGPPLEACQGKRMVVMAGLLTGCECGEGHCTQTGSAVESPFGLCAGLASAYPGHLFGVAAEKRDLTARLVIAGEPLGFQGDIRAAEHRIAVALGMDHDHHLEVALPWHLVEHLVGQPDGFVCGLEALKARSGAPLALAILGLVAPWPWALGTLLAIAHMGLGTPLAKLLPCQSAHASNTFLLAVRPIGDHGTQAAQVVRLAHTAAVVSIAIHPRGLRLRRLSAWGCLLHTEPVGPVPRAIEPRQGRDC